MMSSATSTRRRSPIAAAILHLLKFVASFVLLHFKPRRFVNIFPDNARTRQAALQLRIPIRTGSRTTNRNYVCSLSTSELLVRHVHFERYDIVREQADAEKPKQDLDFSQEALQRAFLCGNALFIGSCRPQSSR